MVGCCVRERVKAQKSKVLDRVEVQPWQGRLHVEGKTGGSKRERKVKNTCLLFLEPSMSPLNTQKLKSRVRLNQNIKQRNLVSVKTEENDFMKIK